MYGIPNMCCNHIENQVIGPVIVGTFILAFEEFKILHVILIANKVLCVLELLTHTANVLTR